MSCPGPTAALLCLQHLPATLLTLAPALSAATVAGRLRSGRANGDSGEDNKVRAAHRLDRCEVRSVVCRDGGPEPTGARGTAGIAAHV